MWGLPRGGELIIILLVVLVLFGPKQLPKLGKMFGKTVKNVREGMEGKFDEEPDEPETLPAAKTEADAKAAKVEDKTEV